MFDRIKNLFRLAVPPAPTALGDILREVKKYREETDSKIRDLQQQLDAMKHELERLRGELNRCEAENARLRKQLSAA